MTVTDALPEYIRYCDTGCDLQPHCLTCPLPVCKEELSQGVRSMRAHMRGLQIALLRSEGRKVRWIAQVMGMSERAVCAASAKARNDDVSPLTDSPRSDKLDVAAQAVASGR